MKARIFFVALLAAVGALFPLSAEYNKLGIPDSTEIRANLVRKWFTAPLDQVRANSREVYTNDIGTHFQVRVEELKDTFAVIVAPEVSMPMELYTESGVEQFFDKEYPDNAYGAWVLVRNSATGKPVSLRVYVSQNSNVFVQFLPERNTVRADFVIDGCFAARGVPTGITFNQLYTASLARILSLTERTLPWYYADVRTGQYGDTLQMIGVIRKNLPRITPTEDAAYNEDGEPISISSGEARFVASQERNLNKLSLSSAGFVKWVVDGLVEPLTGSYTYLAPLLRQTVELNPLSHAGIVYNGRRTEDEKNSDGVEVSFTLNWTRNLAAARLSAQTKKNYLYNESGMDVTVNPFNGELKKDGSVQQAVGYVANTGYQLERLRPLLYTLAINEPTYCYLAAIRTRNDSYIKKANNAQVEEPEIYLFEQAAVIFPYFDSKGIFRCSVFENGKELTLRQFMQKYDGCFVHLTRVLTSRNFFPQ